VRAKLREEFHIFVWSVEADFKVTDGQHEGVREKASESVESQGVLSISHVIASYIALVRGAETLRCLLLCR
jgi:hypothetical protein